MKKTFLTFAVLLMVAIAAFAFPPHYEGNLQLTGDATGLGTNSFTNSLAFKTAANGSMTSSPFYVNQRSQLQRPGHAPKLCQESPLPQG